MSLFPEGNTPLSQDDEKRSLLKWASYKFDLVGLRAVGGFPEGSAPQLQDTEERLLQKINAMS